jgi:hypothetical protein
LKKAIERDEGEMAHPKTTTSQLGKPELAPNLPFGAALS